MLSEETIIDKLKDLHKQAAIERSHYYVASCCLEAIAEIERLNAIIRVLRFGAVDKPPMSGQPKVDLRNL